MWVPLDSVAEVAGDPTGVLGRAAERAGERDRRLPRPGGRRPGAGLGLFLVSNVVRKLGGTLEARNAGDGGGTTVVLRLPSASIAAMAEFVVPR